MEPWGIHTIPYHMGFKWSLFPIGQKSIFLHYFNENNYLKKCIPFTPKQIEIGIENRDFREINCDFIFRQNRTALDWTIRIKHSTKQCPNQMWPKATAYNASIWDCKHVWLWPCVHLQTFFISIWCFLLFKFHRLMHGKLHWA